MEDVNSNPDIRVRHNVNKLKPMEKGTSSKPKS